MQTSPRLFSLSKQQLKFLFLFFFYWSFTSWNLCYLYMWTVILSNLKTRGITCPLSGSFSICPLQAHKRQKCPGGSDMANRITECCSLVKHQPSVCHSAFFGSKLWPCRTKALSLKKSYLGSSPNLLWDAGLHPRHLSKYSIHRSLFRSINAAKNTRVTPSSPRFVTSSNS